MIDREMGFLIAVVVFVFGGMLYLMASEPTKCMDGQVYKDHGRGYWQATGFGCLPGESDELVV